MKVIKWEYGPIIDSQIETISDIFESEEMESKFSVWDSVSFGKKDSPTIECVIDITINDSLSKEFEKITYEYYEKYSNSSRADGKNTGHRVNLGEYFDGEYFDTKPDKLLELINEIKIIKRINILTGLKVGNFLFSSITYGDNPEYTRLKLEFKDV